MSGMSGMNRSTWATISGRPVRVNLGPFVATLS
jgi:hypothetical protein